MKVLLRPSNASAEEFGAKLYSVKELIGETDVDLKATIAANLMLECVMTDTRDVEQIDATLDALAKTLKDAVRASIALETGEQKQ